MAAYGRRTLVIDIKEHTCPSWNTLYKQAHWRQRRDLVDMIHWHVYEDAYDVRQKPFDKPVDISIVAHRRRLIDADNVPAKLYIDGLCQAGVLKDDNRRYVRSVTTRCEKGEPHVVITVQETDKETA